MTKTDVLIEMVKYIKNHGIRGFSAHCKMSESGMRQMLHDMELDIESKIRLAQKLEGLKKDAKIKNKAQKMKKAVAK